MEDMFNDIFGDSGFYAIDDAVLECPCGYEIEWDGRCPEGCASPMLGGFI